MRQTSALILIGAACAAVPTPRPTWAPVTAPNFLQKCIARRASRQQSAHLPLSSAFAYKLRDAPTAVPEETAELKKLREFRGIAKGWYRETFDKIWPYTCYKALAKNTASSVVACSSDDAYKGADGGKLAVGAASSGMCERKSDCYWPEPVPGKARAPKWTPAQLQKSSEVRVSTHAHAHAYTALLAQPPRLPRSPPRRRGLP